MYAYYFGLSGKSSSYDALWCRCSMMSKPVSMTVVVYRQGISRTDRFRNACISRTINSRNASMIHAIEYLGFSCIVMNYDFHISYRQGISRTGRFRNACISKTTLASISRTISPRNALSIRYMKIIIHHNARKS